MERTHSWLSKCRAILIRYDKNSFNDLGLIQLAYGLLWYRRLHRLEATTQFGDSFLGLDRLGVGARVEGDQIRFVFPIAILVGR